MSIQMLFTLGLDSQFGTMQGVVQCMVDLKLFPNVRKEFLTGNSCNCLVESDKYFHNFTVLLGLLCILCFMISLVFSHGAGNYIFTLFDNFSGTIPLLVKYFFINFSVLLYINSKNNSKCVTISPSK